MIRATTFAGKSVALFGLGASGNATALALAAGGASVACWDDAPAARDDARSAGVAVVDLATADWSRFSSLVLAPGVPLTHPEPHWSVARAKASGVEIIGDIEIFARERAAHCPQSPFIGITGTNGKSTTTALIAHILREAGRDVQMGGNIGVPILSLEPPAPERFHVIEISSFQIDLTPTLRPTVGLLLNITPDHLDRHGTVERYAAIKTRLVAGSQVALIGVDDELCIEIGRRFAESEQPDTYPASARENLSWGYFADNNRVISRDCDQALAEAEVLGSIEGIGTLRGRHNLQNAVFACAAAWHCGLRPAKIAAALRTFSGLPHRMEEVGRVGTLLFINDSKATNADSTAKALATFERDIFWIAGGKAKEGGIASLAPHFPAIRKAYLIGAAADAFAATLDSRVATERCGTIDVALERATADAHAHTAAHPSAEPIVLLSPACASYDQFQSFEHRGNVFRDLVAKLPGIICTATQS